MADLDGSDQFAVYTGSDHKKITADQLSQNYNGSYANYKLAVYNSSNGNHYSVKCSELGSKISSSNQSSYHFMISRGSTLYKVAAEKVLGLLGSRWGFDFNITSFTNAGVELQPGYNNPLIIEELIPNLHGEVYGVGRIDWKPYSANMDGFAFKLNADGSLAWTRTFHSPPAVDTGYQSERIFSATVDSSGNLVFSGNYQDDQSPYGFKSVGFFGKIDRNGNFSNMKKILNFSVHVSSRDIVNTGNDIYAIRHVWNNSSSNIIFFNSDLTKNSANTIAIGGGHVNGMIHDGSNIYLSGKESYSVALFRKIDSSGNTSWSRTLALPFSRSCSGNHVALSGSDPVFYASEYAGSYPGTYWDRVALVKYNSSGTLQWYRGLDLGYNGHLYTNGKSRGITADDDGNIYLLASSFGSPRKDYIIKFNSSGTLQWTRSVTFSNLVHSNSQAITINAQGMLVISFGMVIIQVDKDGDFTGSFGSNVPFTIASDSVTVHTSTGSTLGNGNATSSTSSYWSSSNGPVDPGSEISTVSRSFSGNTFSI